jgi:choice-of-anchor B domain-containing protein
MKKLVLLFSTLLIFISNTAILKGQNVALLGSLNPYPGTAYSDIWGYSAEGREYAFLGVTGGTSIIDVTDPSNPQEIVLIQGPLAPPYEWRDLKTYSHYLYITSEGFSGGGLQIVDLSMLPDTAFLVNTYNQTFTSAHNLYIDDGYAYVVGTSSGGMHILDLTNPVNPVQVAYYGSSGYVHDVYVWNDTAYVSSENTYDLVNLTNKSNPQLINQSAALPGIYAHSGWLTEDKRYFIACEEFNVRDLTIWDLQDRSTWNLTVSTWQMSGSNPIHNVFILGDYAHLSYYKDGYVVLNVSDPANPQFAGQYDTYPGSGGGTYNGSWGVYPYLPSGNTIVSDMSTGLYICRFASIPVEFTSFTATSSGNSVILNWSTSTETNNSGFEIERNSENEFVTIGFVKGSGTTTEPNQYSFTDKNLDNGFYNYRLKQVDYDGTIKYSDIAEVEVLTVTTMDLKQNYPNPFNPSTKIKYTIPEKGFVNLSVYNLLGEKVTELVNGTLDEGEYETVFNGDGLTSGIYIAKLTAGNNFHTIRMSLTK